MKAFKNLVVIAGTTIFTWTGSLALADVAAPDNATSMEATAQMAESEVPRTFNGFYAGVEIGAQNVFSGAFLDGVDVLAQDSRTVMELSLGWRKELDNRLVFGVEIRFGLLDGDLELVLPDSLRIDYENDRQAGFRIFLGRVLGKRRGVLVYAYYGQTQRRFDLLIQAVRVSFGQRDSQGFENFGVGVEKRLARKWNARATVGSTGVDFGGLTTNVDIDQDVEAAIGLTYRFGRRK